MSDVEEYIKTIDLWESENTHERMEAVEILERLCASETDVFDAYTKLARVKLEMNAEHYFSDIVDHLQDACINTRYHPTVASDCSDISYSLGTELLEVDANHATMIAYMFSLQFWIGSGNEFPEDAGLQQVVAFTISRNLVAKAHNEGDEKFGEMFFEFCEKLSIDPSQDVELKRS